MSLLMLCTSDVYTLIDYSSFIESMFIMWSVAGLLWLRYREPDLERPIKVLTENNHSIDYYYYLFVYLDVLLDGVLPLGKNSSMN